MSRSPIVFWLAAAAAAGSMPGAAHAQAIICCSSLVDVGGPWIGASRVNDCQEYFDTAPAPVACRMCEARSKLGCLDMRRCAELGCAEEPGEEPGAGGGATLPPDADVSGGVDEGFGGPRTPPAPDTPPRLVYLVAVDPETGQTITRFTAWLDAAACPLPITGCMAQASEEGFSPSRRVVFGAVARGGGRTRVEARALELATGAVTGPVTGEATGEDRDAVAAATRAALEALDLVCGGDGSHPL